MDDCIDSIDKNYASVATFLDFSKAFDTLDHDLLCAKLQYYGFDLTTTIFLDHIFPIVINKLCLNQENLN